MRTILVATATAAIFVAGALFAGRADAMTLAAPAGLRPAIQDTSAVEQTRYVCYRVWRRGHWRQHCSWRPSYYGYPYHYGYRRPYYYGPYAYAPWRYHRRPGVSLHFRF